MYHRSKFEFRLAAYLEFQKKILRISFVLDCTNVFSAYEMQLLYVPGPEDPCSNIEVDFEG